ncbi:MAG: Mu-like prophage major head subunit gpT family protein [Rhodoferax sp.]|nr:prohead protease/major capsid protein fusion protein [Rhodoferax sp.]MDP3650519.1 Mu-like prophage major head subunit gpT family protein [Rhodoferax sp.]
MPTTTAPEARQARRADMPLASLQMAVRNFTRADPAASEPAAAPAARFEIVFTTGAPVRRYDWQNGRYYMEQLEVTPEAVNLDRMKRGVSFLNSHSSWSLEDIIGVVDQPEIANGIGTAQAQLSRRESVRGIVQDMEDRVIRHVSVGYARDAIEMVAPSEATGMWIYRVTRWTPVEVSPVPIPADMDSEIRSEGGRLLDREGRELRTYPCVVTDANTPEQRTAAPAAMPPIPTAGNQAATQTRNFESATMTPEEIAAAAAATLAARSAPAAPEQADAARAAGMQAERTRQTDIRAAVQAARSTLGADADALSIRLIDAGTGIDEARREILDALAKRSDATASRGAAGNIETVRDETVMRRDGMAEAISHRMAPSQAQLTDNGRQYRYMSLSRMSEAILQARGENTHSMSPMEIAGRAMTTGDLPAIMSNVANKRLRKGYEGALATYASWARRAPNASNFKSVDVVQMSASPDLLKVNEHGEFQYGKISDGKESYSVVTRGRIINFTRQMIINDDLRSLDRVVTGFGASGRRLENRLVYAELTANAALGNDSVALFHATHSNLAASGAAISDTTLNTARTAMRLQKGLEGEELGIVPAFLIVPATQEQVAYKWTSANYVPAKAGDTNEFRAGGRTALEPIVEAILDATSTTAWYLAASGDQTDTVEYMYLDGSEGVYLETEYSFDTDGMKMKARHDFAAKAIDYRGLYKNPGA